MTAGSYISGRDGLSSDPSAVSGLSGGRLDLPGLQPAAPDMDVLRGAGGPPPAGPDSSPGGESVLGRAAAIRFPDLGGLAGRERIEALVDHINATAIARGELEELRLEAHTRLFDAAVALAALPSTGANKAAIDLHRRRARPDLAAAVDGAKWLVDRCAEQISRLGGTDYDAASRIYTLLGG